MSLPPSRLVCKPYCLLIQHELHNVREQFGSLSITVWHVPLIHAFTTLHSSALEILKCALFIAANTQKSCLGLVSKVFGKHQGCILRIK